MHAFQHFLKQFLSFYIFEWEHIFLILGYEAEYFAEYFDT